MSWREDDLLRRMRRQPRVRLGCFPTPLHDLPRFSQTLGGPAVWIKREDLAGLALGGNKVRMLEFLLGQATSQGADTVLIPEQFASNFSVQTIAAANRLGLQTVVVRFPSGRPIQGGNATLIALLGGEVKIVSEPWSELPSVTAQLMAELTRAGRRPYAIPIPYTLGALAAAECAVEAVQQGRERGTAIDVLVCCSDSATHAGALLAARLAGAPRQVIGITPISDAEEARQAVAEIANQAGSLLGLQPDLTPVDVVSYDEYRRPAYGLPSAEGERAIELLARTEGILLDPLYTGKAMAGLIDLAARGVLLEGQTVVFVHTGGTPSLFSEG